MSIFHRQQLKSSLAITTMVGCKNNCSYCPQLAFIQAYKKPGRESLMSFETFAGCIRSVPREICLSFSGFCEPWLNPQCTRMILHAHEQKFRIRVNTTLIGMTEEDVHELKKVPFIKFVVHLPDDQELTRIKVDEGYLHNLRLVLQEPPENLMWKFHHTASGACVHPRVKQILYEHDARIRFVGLNSRAGRVDLAGKYHLPNRGKVLRPCQDFHHNILLPNGDVALCHMDWSLRHILGNLLSTDYARLHQGKAFHEILAALDDPGAAILCRECEKDIVLRSLPDHLLHQLKKRVTGNRDPY